MYSNDGLSRNYAPAGQPARYPEAAYGFQRFTADVGRTKLVGFNRLNPQLQERVIPVELDRRWDGRRCERDDDRRRVTRGTPAPDGARNRSARHYTK